MADTAPVTVVTGPSGSDRSTWLNHLLRQPAQEGAVVLTDRAGAAAISHPHIRVIDPRPRQFAVGCPCCATSDDLSRALREFLPRARRGEVSAVFIDIADPLPVMTTLLTDRIATAAFHLGQIVTVIGARGGAAALADHAPTVVQAALADRIVVVETAASASLDLTARLRALNPYAPVTTMLPATIVAPVTTLAPVTTPRPAAAPLPETFHGHACGIDSFGTLVSDPSNWPLVSARLAAAVQATDAHLLRVTGVVRLPQGESSLVIQGIRHLLMPARPLAARPLAAQSSVPQAVLEWPDGLGIFYIRFVTQGLSRPALAAALAAILTPTAAIG